MVQIIEYIDHILNGPFRVLLQMVDTVPDEKIQFKPYSESMSLTELVCHILSVMQIHIHAVSEGQGIEEHAQRIPVVPKNINTTSALINHMKEVLQSIVEEIPSITSDTLERVVVYKQWNDYEIQGNIALCYIVEEFFHHRGQLSVYLRLLGLEPPFLYTY